VRHEPDTGQRLIFVLEGIMKEAGLPPIEPLYDLEPKQGSGPTQRTGYQDSRRASRCLPG
jgi:hypothetical protein